MRATAWHNGESATEPGGYGLKITAADRDRYFEKAWAGVMLDLDGGGKTEITLTSSFWQRCTELRSADVGRWLLEAGIAPWPTGMPPGVVLTPLDGNHFGVRKLEHHNLL